MGIGSCLFSPVLVGVTSATHPQFLIKTSPGKIGIFLLPASHGFVENPVNRTTSRLLYDLLMLGDYPESLRQRGG